VGKRRTQAKGKQLSLATIVWSKAQCAPHRPEGLPYKIEKRPISIFLRAVA